MASQLHRRYPENYLLHLNQAQILERMGKKGDAAQVYTLVASNAARGVPNYQKLPLGKIRYPLGQRLLALGDPKEALDQFRDAAGDTSRPEQERALAHLKAGEILDDMGRRDEAIVHYREVTRFEDVDGSHGAAERYLKAYAPDEEQ